MKSHIYKKCSCCNTGREERVRRAGRAGTDGPHREVLILHRHAQPGQRRDPPYLQNSNVGVRGDLARGEGWSDLARGERWSDLARGEGCARSVDPGPRGGATPALLLLCPLALHHDGGWTRGVPEPARLHVARLGEEAQREAEEAGQDRQPDTEACSQLSVVRNTFNVSY